MPTISEVSICNQALGWLGASRIATLDGSDRSTEALLCIDNYAPLRRAVLEEGRWTFATKRFTLAPMADKPEAYGYQFLISNDILNVIEARDETQSFRNGVSNIDWRLEEDRILADVAVLYIKALIDVTDPTKFSPMFVQALAARIAAELAPVVTESSTKAQQMWALYESKVTNAITTDGMQGKRDRLRGRSLTSRVR